VRELEKKTARKPHPPKPADKPEVVAEDRSDNAAEQKAETPPVPHEKPAPRKKKEKPPESRLRVISEAPPVPVQKPPAPVEVAPAFVVAQKPTSWLKTEVLPGRHRVDIFQAWSSAARDELDLLTGSLSQEEVMEIRTELMTIQGRVVNNLKKTAYKHADGLDLQTPLARHVAETILKDEEAAYSAPACEAARRSFKSISERFCVTARGDFVERANSHAAPSEKAAAPELMTA
jgi:hypothetical protein